MYCQKSLNESAHDLYFKTDNNSIKYFHKNCYNENNINNKTNNNFNYLLFNEEEKYKLYNQNKENILSKNDYIISKELINDFFRDLEEENNLITHNRNILRIGNEQFLKELEKFKDKFFLMKI